MERPGIRSVATLIVVLAALALLAGCGGDDADGGTEPSTRDAPAAADFPSAEGKTMQQLVSSTEGVEKTEETVLAPVGRVFDRGPNRYAFAVVDVGGDQILDADVAMYFAHGAEGKVIGPLPARVESMETKPAFAAMTTYQDPGAAKAVYVVPKVPLNRDGEWIAVGLIRDGDGFEAAVLPSPVVGQEPKIPAVGEKAPKIETPTPGSVGGDLAKIDTRVPPTDMHANFADVVGKKPVVLLFATPQLCQSRVCGPVVDVEAQVQAETGDEVEFIHMEIFNQNDPNKGTRPQVQAFNLQTEPWLFVIDADGIIRTRIEGAFGLDELRRAVRQVAPASAKS